MHWRYVRCKTMNKTIFLWDIYTTMQKVKQWTHHGSPPPPPSHLPQSMVDLSQEVLRMRKPWLGRMRTPSRMTPIPHPYPLHESHYIRFMKPILLFFLIYEYHIWNKQEFVMQMRNFLDKIYMRNPRLNYGMRMLIVSKLPSTIWISNFFFIKLRTTI